MLASYGMGLAVLLGAVVLEFSLGIPVGELTRDTVNSQGLPPYMGAISNLGVLLWCATVTLCLFTAYLLRQTRGHRPFPSSFFLTAAALTAALMFDDLFILHEWLLPRYLGIPELATYCAYATGGMAFLLYFRNTIVAHTHFLLLLTSVVFLCSSIVADTLTNSMPDSSGKFFIEDGLKLLGICGWFSYFAHTSMQVTGRFLRVSAAEPRS